MKVLASILAAAYSQNLTYDDYRFNFTSDYFGNDYSNLTFEAAAVDDDVHIDDVQVPPAAETLGRPAIDDLAWPTISCWTCKNAKSAAACRENGYVQQCESNEQVCEIEVRKRGGRRVESVSTGCKWRRACLDNKRQNFIDPNKNQHQCRPAKWHQTTKNAPSVCRQCCDVNKAGQLDEECGIKFIEEYNGKAPPQKPRWRDDLLSPTCDCEINGEPKVTIQALTGTGEHDDSDGVKYFKPVKSGCNFEWILMNNENPIDDFEKNQTDTFEYNMTEIHENADCLRNIDQIEIMDESGNGWGAEWVNMIVKDVEHCKTEINEFDGPFWVDKVDGEVTADKTNGSEEEHCTKHVCAIDGTEDKVTITALTADVPGADTDKQQKFMFVSDNQDCNFDWEVLDHKGSNNFEKGKTDVFEFDFKDILDKPHCFQDIKEIKFVNGDCKGDQCNEWMAESIEVAFQKRNECKTNHFRFDNDVVDELWIDETETTLKIRDAKTKVDNHWE